MAWVVEMTGSDAGTEKTVLFALGGGVAFVDGAYADGSLLSWESPSQRIEIGAEGVSRIEGDKGKVVLANMPPSIGEPGPLDAMADWVWQNRTATIYWVDSNVWDDKVRMAVGVLEQPIAGVGQTSTLSFELRDPRSALETPLQTITFAGSNVGPVGVEGGPDLKGRPKPVVYGLVSNVSPPRVNDSLLIYQLSDTAVEILCVRDGGIPLTPGVARDGINALQASTPDPGTYDYFSQAAGADRGTFIRLGSTPIFDLTVDADEAATEADQSHARIWKRIRTDRIGSTVVDASVVETDALDDAGAGFFWSDTISQKDALDEVLASFSGYEVQQHDGDWRVGKLTAPEEPSVLDLLHVAPDTRMSVKARALLADITRVRPSYAPTGAPPYKVTVNWGRNYTVMDASQFAGGAARRLKDKFSSEYRVASAVDTSIWDPETMTGPWVRAPELTVNSAYQPGPDGLASPGAEAEAQRLLTLLTPLSAHYQVSFIPEVGDILEPGFVVGMTYPRMDMQYGAIFRVLQYRLTVDKGGARAGLVLGLKSPTPIGFLTTAAGKIITTASGAFIKTE
jgi:hypothetical protein